MRSGTCPPKLEGLCMLKIAGNMVSNFALTSMFGKVL